MLSVLESYEVPRSSAHVGNGLCRRHGRHLSALNGLAGRSSRPAEETQVESACFGLACAMRSERQEARLATEDFRPARDELRRRE